MDSGDDEEPARSARQVMTGEDSLSKAVSANITNILEDLLKDYDKTERPSYNEGIPIIEKKNNLVGSGRIGNSIFTLHIYITYLFCWAFFLYFVSLWHYGSLVSVKFVK